MSAVKLRVVFDNLDRVYYSGEKVTGRVELELQTTLKIRGIEIKIKGEAKCKWYKHKNELGHPKIVPRSSSEIYINSRQTLIGGEDKFELPEGEHTYPFAIRLPNEAPTSFSGRHGEISYHGKAKIDIPFGNDIEERTEFTVIRPLNFDLFPHLRIPYEDEKSKTFHCLWCANGPLTIAVRLPRTGFAASEFIPIAMEVDNASTKSVHEVHVYLKRTICWIADGHEKWKFEILRSLRFDTVAEGQSRRWSGNFKIPSASYPNLAGCTIIKMNHDLYIETVTSSGSDLHIRVPVKIVDNLIHNDSKAETIKPQIKTIPKNVTGEPGIQMPVSKMPSPNPNHNQSVENNSNPENSCNVSFEEPSLQICPSADPDHAVPQPEINNTPSNTSFVEPDTNLNAGEIPQMPTQENLVFVQQYPLLEFSPLPSLPSQPVINLDCSQNALYHPATDYDFTLPSFNSDVQLEMTPFLNDSKDQTIENDENVIVALPPFLLSPSTHPPS